MRIEVHRADAFDLPADVLLFGKTPALRERIERAAGKQFRPYARHAATPQGRSLTAVRSNRLPWSTAVSMRYHPRNGPLDALAVTPPHMPHLWKLFSDLDFLLTELCGPDGAERVLILPFSARNPQVVALATVAALWNYAHFRRLNQLMVRRILWNEAAAQGNAKRIEDLSRPRCFMIADLEDPSPYEAALEDGGELVRRAMHWEEHRPYRRV